MTASLETAISAVPVAIVIPDTSRKQREFQISTGVEEVWHRLHMCLGRLLQCGTASGRPEKEGVRRLGKEYASWLLHPGKSQQHSAKSPHPRKHKGVSWHAVALGL